MVKTFGRAVLGTLFTLAAGAAHAAELKVFSTIGVQAALEQLEPQFEKQVGAKLSITWATAAMLVKRVAAGETADCYVLTAQGFDALVKQGKATGGPDSTFASSAIAMVVKKGASKPDISTPDAFKQTLLKAKSIAYSNPAAGGASGVYLAKLLERMGIADQFRRSRRERRSRACDPAGAGGDFGQRRRFGRTFTGRIESRHRLRRRRQSVERAGGSVPGFGQVSAFAGGEGRVQGSRADPNVTA
jgi:ABC-type molybdate transport system substrate-binding protein